MPAGFWQGCCSDITSQHVGFFCSRSRPFHFYWTSWSVSWPSPRAEQCLSGWRWHLACHLILLIWCYLWTRYHVLLCPCAGHWWDVEWHGHRTPLQGCPHCWLPAGHKPLISQSPSSLGSRQFSAQLTSFIQAVFPFRRHEKYYPTQ